MDMLVDRKLAADFSDYHKCTLRDRVNLVAVAETHILWKTRLGQHVRGGTDELLESAMVGQNGICRLGVWIKGFAFTPLGGTKAYHQLINAHQRFHQLGDVVMAKLKEGDYLAAEGVYLGGYSQSLQQIIQALTDLNQLLQE
jgi:hypothetical protein